MKRRALLKFNDLMCIYCNIFGFSIDGKCFIEEDVEFLFDEENKEKEESEDYYMGEEDCLSLEELVKVELKEENSKCEKCLWNSECSYADKMIGCSNLSKVEIRDCKEG